MAAKVTIKQVADKKVVVFGFSGNVGKTVIASELLYPRIKNAEFYSIETINSDSTHGEKLAGNQFSELLEAIEMSDSCVVDVGSSNIEAFLTRMRSFKNSHEEIDYFVIPVTPSSKEMRDSEALIDYILEMGIPKNKIKVVFNKVERDFSNPASELAFFKNSIAEEIAGNNPPVVYLSDYYPMLRDSEKTHSEVISDTRDFNALKKSAETKDARFQIVLEKKLQQAGLSAEEDLASAFTALKL
ncbi:StbB family protein [Kushneria indalinina]|uniref:StbB n=1 Tax=Kushneria indalinina DSM 14324 TaxID=1122140 RepID=A0A3D9DRG8_9GAMM|nr:StbB family protein [Kushneria indalinina]REC93318.1 hypothetical protein C8D72_3476 [Kushneria indalinina DSM 14324]